MSLICSVPYCGRKHLAHGFCSAHYQRHLRGQSMEPPVGYKRLNCFDHDRAVMMWMRGLDTLDIAKAFDIPESYIYNRLPSWLERGHDAERPQWKCA